MRRNFNIRMALTNIKNNQNIYLPYFMAASLIVMLFYSLRSVSFMVANSTAAGGGTHQKGGGKQRSGKFFELFHFWFSFQCVHFTLLI